MITVAALAAGCNFYHGEDGEDGSVNMRVAHYEIVDKDWQFDDGQGPQGLNRHYYYTVDARMDRDLELYLNSRTFDDTIIMVEREIEVWDQASRKYVIVRVSVPNTSVIEEESGNPVPPQHTEIITYNYGVNPAQINFHYFDSRFMDDSEYEPVTMNFRVVFMWP